MVVTTTVFPTIVGFWRRKRKYYEEYQFKQPFEEESNDKDIEIPKYYSFTIEFNAT